MISYRLRKKWVVKVQLCLTKNTPKVQMCNFNVYEYSLSQDMLGTFSLLLFYENIFEFLGYLLYFLAISWHFSIKSSNIIADSNIFSFSLLLRLIKYFQVANVSEPFISKNQLDRFHISSWLAPCDIIGRVIIKSIFCICAKFVLCISIEDKTNIEISFSTIPRWIHSLANHDQVEVYWLLKYLINKEMSMTASGARISE